MAQIYCYQCNRYIGIISGKLAPGTRHICKDYPDCDDPNPPATVKEYNGDVMDHFGKFTGIKFK